MTQEEESDATGMASATQRAPLRDMVANVEEGGDVTQPSEIRKGSSKKRKAIVGEEGRDNADMDVKQDPESTISEEKTFEGGKKDKNKQKHKKMKKKQKLELQFENDPFLGVLEKSGISFDPKARNFQCTEQHKALVRLEKLLEVDGDSKERVEIFISGLDNFVLEGDFVAMKSLLEPFGKVSSVAISGSESVMKILLQVETIQPEIISNLTTWIIEQSSNEEEENADLAKQFLHQLRFLNIVVDGEQLANSLMECLSSVCQLGNSSQNLAREIINVIPEVLEDAQHPNAVAKLKELLEEERELTVPIIECLGNLRIPLEFENELRQTVLQTLSSAPFGDLPVAIQFLVDSLSKGNDPASKHCKAQVIGDLRRRFMQISTDDIVQREMLASQDTGMTSGRSGDSHIARRALNSNHVQNIMRTLTRCLIVRADLCKLYLEAIDVAVEELDSQEHVSVIDFWLLVALRAHDHYSRQITTIVRKHASRPDGESIDKTLIKSAILGHKDVLEENFKNFLNLAGTLLCAEGLRPQQRNDGYTISHLREIGKTLYKCLFREFREPYFRQELVVALVMHCGASSEDEQEVEGGLECLSELLDDPCNIRAMEPFIEFVKTLIQGAPQLRVKHARMVFSILSKFVLSRSNNEVGATAWFHVLLRKLLTNPSDRFRIAGAIGAVQFINTHAIVEKDATENADKNKKEDEQDLFNVSDEEDDLLQQFVQSHVSDEEQSDSECKTVFDLALGTCRSSAQAMMAFCEELGSMVDGPDGHLKHLHPGILQYIAEELSIEFNHRFVRRLPPEGIQKKGTAATAAASSSSSSSSIVASKRETCLGEIEVHPLYACFGGNSTQAIDILPQLANGMKDPKIQERFHFLMSMLRATIAFSHLIEDKARKVNDLLGAPLMLAKLEEYTKMFPENEGNDDIEDDAALNLEMTQVTLCLSLYHSINWIRECINGYSPDYKDKDTMSQLVNRFELLHQLQVLLIKLLRGASCHSVWANLPVQGNESFLIGTERNSSKGAKSRSSKRGRKTASEELPKDFEALLAASFRPFRSSVYNLLNSPTMEENPLAARTILASLQVDLKTQLNPTRSGFGRSKKKVTLVGATGIGDSVGTKLLLDEVQRVDFSPKFMLQCIGGVMRSIRKLVDKFSSKIVEDIVRGELVDHLRGSIVEAAKVIQEIVRCPLSKSDRRFKEMVIELLICFGAPESSDIEDVLNMSDPMERIAEAVKVFEELFKNEQLAKIEIKLDMMTLLQDMAAFVEDREGLQERISRSCKGMLKEPFSQTKMNKTILGRLIEMHLHLAEDPVKALSTMASDMDVMALESKDSGKIFLSLTPQSLTLFYEPVLKALALEIEKLQLKRLIPASHLKKSQHSKSQKRKKTGDDDVESASAPGPISEDHHSEAEVEELARMSSQINDLSSGAGSHSLKSAPNVTQTNGETATTVLPETAAEAIESAHNLFRELRKLTNITLQCSDKKALLIMAVRHGRAIVERIIKECMPFFSFAFRHKQNQFAIKAALKCLQSSTKQMERICEEGKRKKTIQLVSMVPQLRKTLETFIYATKHMMQENGALAAFERKRYRKRHVDGSERD